MKTVIFALFSSMLLSATAQAKWSQTAQWSNHAQRVADALNVVYPELQLKIAQDGSDETILNELAILRDAIHGRSVDQGSLVHLACSAPACGRGTTK